MASLEALPNGTFRVVWREGGVKQRERFETRAAAEKFYVDCVNQGNRWPRGWVPGYGWLEDVPQLHAPTFREWAERSISSRATANERTRHDYRRQAELHLYPTFGAKRVDEITREDVGRWVIALRAADRPPSPKTLKNVQNLASTIMRDAIEHQHAAANPFRGALRALPASKQEDMVCLTRQEFETLLRVTPEPWQPLVMLLFLTGLRWSEATALRIEDVDLLGKKLRVVRAWKRTPGNYMVIGEPKSRRSRRTITISQRLVSALIPLTIDRDPGALLFVTPATGRRVSHSNFRYRVWVPILEKLAAEKITKRPRIHDCRHAHASWLIGEGVPISVVSRRLGHESIETTMRTYFHLLPDADDVVSAVMDDWAPDVTPIDR